MVADILTEATEAAQALLPGQAVKLEPVPGGANNRAWRVQAAGGPYLLKQYYSQPAPARDRYASERAFYAFAATRAPDAIPKTLGWDDSRRTGLFEYIHGRKLEPKEVNDARVREALEFFRALNQPPAPATTPLPEAAEACFRIEDHVALVEKRVRRLLEIQAAGADEVGVEARAFIASELSPAWQKIATGALDRAKSLDAKNPARCVSPSDFGFHNVLLEASGRLRFFDFEYAGWDDPAKTVGDFMSQPDIPVGWERRSLVLDAVGALFPGDPTLRVRAELLLPVYQVKWCCIMLNEFLPAGQQRRAFSLSPEAAHARRRRQIDRARAALAATTSRT